MVEEDLVVGTVPLVPLEPFEWLELSGEFSVLEFVFLRRNSLKKGIVRCRYRCHAAYPKTMYVSKCLENDMCAHGEGRTVGMLNAKEAFAPELMPRVARRS